MLLAGALGGCANKATKAHDRYEFLKEQHASYSEVCAAGKEMVRAYSEASDKLHYGDAVAVVDVECLTGELHGQDQPYREASPR